MVTLPNTIEMALVIAKLEGPAVSQYFTLRILPATLDESLYDLAGELPIEGLYPLVVTPFRHRPSLYPFKLCLLHFLLASSPLFIVGLRPDQAIQTGGGGSPQPPWRDGEVVISLGGFAGVALHRCLRRSGQLLPPPSSLVSSCDRFGKNFPLLFQVEKAISRLIELLLLCSSSFRRKLAAVLCLSWCSDAGILCTLLDSQSKAWQLLEIAMSGLDFTACDGRTRTCRPCFAYPSVEAPSRRSVVPRTVLRLRFSIDPSDFDAGSTALSCRLSVLDSLGLDSSKPIVSHCFIINSSFKEQSLHVASVKSILESHASYLMSGKELSSCAQLENFAAGLELIGQKLQISELQNRLDAEFLPAQMCSVKFKEWIVVLATLLQRSESLESVQISKADSEPTWLIAVKGRARRDIGLDLINGLIL
ncbi:hypothetical protein Bca4012_100023 [Brassica carinata]